MAGTVIRKHYYFSGRVQGVGFRYKAMYLARSLDLTGWAENLWDGRVEMEVQGEAAKISRLISRLQDDRFIVIDDIQEREIPVVEERGFGVKGY
ncbi:MAG: acylphosphatase [Lachnospiraceae bacterium]|nr:acylphosphatase [Lachnospiraceae bacterium]